MRAIFALVVATLLAAAVAGGLLRAGVALPLPAGAAWPGQAVLAHGFLMICGFMGTVIALERAVAVKGRLVFVAPLASALAGVAMLAGAFAPAAWLAVVAALGFIGVNVVVVERQPAPHSAVLLAGAFAWLVGNLLHALGSRAAAVVPWWFAFLVLTIAAERLEMTRLMRHRRGAAPVLYLTLGAMLCGAAAFAVSPRWGGVVYGASLAALAAWLVACDVARRTVATHGLARYMAVCLLLGYAWLAVAGLAWAAGSFGWPARDIALHALGLGFVFSMMLGHGPVVLPALARIKLQFGAFFYVPVALLNVSLAWRLGAGHFAFERLSLGAAGNALAIVLFALTMAGAAIAWRARQFFGRKGAHLTQRPGPGAPPPAQWAPSPHPPGAASGPQTGWPPLAC